MKLIHRSLLSDSTNQHLTKAAVLLRCSAFSFPCCYRVSAIGLVPAVLYNFLTCSGCLFLLFALSNILRCYETSLHDTTQKSGKGKAGRRLSQDERQVNGKLWDIFLVESSSGLQVYQAARDLQFLLVLQTKQMSYIWRAILLYWCETNAQSCPSYPFLAKTQKLKTKYISQNIRNCYHLIYLLHGWETISLYFCS
jgi:hypothetical protein